MECGHRDLSQSPLGAGTGRCYKSRVGRAHLDHIQIQQRQREEEDIRENEAQERGEGDRAATGAFGSLPLGSMRSSAISLSAKLTYMRCFTHMHIIPN